MLQRSVSFLVASVSVFAAASLAHAADPGPAATPVAPVASNVPAPALEVVKLKVVNEGEPVVSPIDSMVDSLLAHVTDKETSEVDHKAAFDELVALEEPAVLRLTATLGNSAAPFNSRWVAARALGRIGGAPATKTLRDTLAKDKFSMIRVAAISALKDLHDDGSYDGFVKALSDDALVVRSAAADALGALGNPKAIPALTKALDREDNFYRGRSLWVRRHIIAALGATESRTTVPTFIKALDDVDPNVHREAISQLERVTKVTFKVPAANEDEWMTRATPKWKAWWEQNKKDYAL